MNSELDDGTTIPHHPSAHSDIDHSAAALAAADDDTDETISGSKSNCDKYSDSASSVKRCCPHTFQQSQPASPSAVIQASSCSTEPTTQEASTDDSGDICWICLDGATVGSSRYSTSPSPQTGAATADEAAALTSGQLIRPCRCPRLSHATCIARWQLQSAGTRREKLCEFCSQTLPDWKVALTPLTGCSAQAVMNVNFETKVYSFEVRPGPEGYDEFTSSIRNVFTLPRDSELNITFTCDDPLTGALLTLHGEGAYDAAVHCAAISAARKAALGGGISAAGGSTAGGGGVPVYRLRTRTDSEIVAPQEGGRNLNGRLIWDSQREGINRSAANRGTAAGTAAAGRTVFGNNPTMTTVAGGERGGRHGRGSEEGVGAAAVDNADSGGPSSWIFKVMRVLGTALCRMMRPTAGVSAAD